MPKWIWVLGCSSFGAHVGLCSTCNHSRHHWGEQQVLHRVPCRLLPQPTNAHRCWPTWGLLEPPPNGATAQGTWGCGDERGHNLLNIIFFPAWLLPSRRQYNILETRDPADDAVLLVAPSGAGSWAVRPCSTDCGIGAATEAARLLFKSKEFLCSRQPAP